MGRHHQGGDPRPGRGCPELTGAPEAEKHKQGGKRKYRKAPQLRPHVGRRQGQDRQRLHRRERLHSGPEMDPVPIDEALHGPAIYPLVVERQGCAEVKENDEAGRGRRHQQCRANGRHRQALALAAPRFRKGHPACAGVMAR